MDASEKTEDEEPGDFRVCIFGSLMASNAIQVSLERARHAPLSCGFILTFLSDLQSFKDQILNIIIAIFLKTTIKSTVRLEREHNAL